jgi:hypothetical protein
MEDEQPACAACTVFASFGVKVTFANRIWSEKKKAQSYALRINVWHWALSSFSQPDGPKPLTELVTLSKDSFECFELLKCSPDRYDRSK